MKLLITSDEIISAVEDAKIQAGHLKMHSTNYTDDVVFECGCGGTHRVNEIHKACIMGFAMPVKFLFLCPCGYITFVQVKGSFQPKATSIFTCKSQDFDDAGKHVGTEEKEKMVNNKLSLGRTLDKLSAKILVPICLMLFYGIYRIVIYGWKGDSIYYSYVPIVLALLGCIGLLAYVSRNEKRYRSIVNELFASAGFLPFISLCYMIFFLGVYGLFTLISDFHIAVLFRSLIFMLWGYRGIIYLAKLTDFGN